MRPRHSFVVLQSFPPPRSTTNPYVVMLADSLRALPTVEVRYFSWKTALLSRYDVFHAHWPEILASGRSPLRKLVRQALFVLLLLKLRITRTPAVRTLHNLHLPDGISRCREVAAHRARTANQPVHRAESAHTSAGRQTPRAHSTWPLPRLVRRAGPVGGSSRANRLLRADPQI